MDLVAVFAFLFVYMLVPLCFCVVTVFSVNIYFYIACIVSDIISEISSYEDQMTKSQQQSTTVLSGPRSKR